ncbi:hypothetical protein EJ04DRAFT_438922 [Polyplosphaeria fusca]|uniref:Uncharacterized protein n=1 Tax=Polyplosphaeria fusca TaxID=682080 RepID=A0A9P4QZ33_9PLEO|nr:hypothetical protein EJ04DRAFT_438922 [Polyplosphaeria fusca]
MPDALATASIALYALCWPFLKLARGLAVLLSPFWALARFLLLPVTYLATALFTLLSLPFSLNLLDRVETIYAFLGIAGLIGCITGALLYFFFDFLSSTLGINDPPDTDAHANGRTVSAHRAARRKRKAEAVNFRANPAMPSAASPQRRRGLLAQTIIEEEDSDL